MESLIANITGKVRRESRNGRDYIVAPISLIVPGVLNGSRGRLYYPRDEVARSVDIWNGQPLVVYHPTNNGRPVSARNPDVAFKSKVGRTYNARLDRNGRLIADAWFDVETANRVDKRILNSLQSGTPMEISTGLFTDTIDAEPGSVDDKGRAYDYVARNYRADHIAILPDQRGACSLEDGCGLLVTHSRWETLNAKKKGDDESEGGEHVFETEDQRKAFFGKLKAGDIKGTKSTKPVKKDEGKKEAPKSSWRDAQSRSKEHDEAANKDWQKAQKTIKDATAAQRKIKAGPGGFHADQVKRYDDLQKKINEAKETIKSAEKYRDTGKGASSTPTSSTTSTAPKSDYTKGWHGGREEVFVEMRKIRAEADRNWKEAQRLGPQGGSLSIGSADFDHTLKATVADEFLRSLNKGKTPKEAHDDAVEAGRDSVKKWNEKTSKGRVSIGGHHQLTRWGEAGTDYADALLRRFRHLTNNRWQTLNVSKAGRSIPPKRGKGKGDDEESGKDFASDEQRRAFFGKLRQGKITETKSTKPVKKDADKPSGERDDTGKESTAKLTREDYVSTKSVHKSYDDVLADAFGKGDKNKVRQAYEMLKDDVRSGKLKPAEAKEVLQKIQQTEKDLFSVQPKKTDTPKDTSRLVEKMKAKGRELQGEQNPQSKTWGDLYPPWLKEATAKFRGEDTPGEKSARERGEALYQQWRKEDKEAGEDEKKRNAARHRYESGLHKARIKVTSQGFKVRNKSTRIHTVRNKAGIEVDWQTLNVKEGEDFDSDEQRRAFFGKLAAGEVKGTKSTKSSKPSEKKESSKEGGDKADTVSDVAGLMRSRSTDAGRRIDHDFNAGRDHLKKHGGKLVRSTKGVDGSTIETWSVKKGGRELLASWGQYGKNKQWTFVYNALPSESADVSPEKACKILHDGTAQGHPLTDKQRKMFGAICGERTDNAWQTLNYSPDQPRDARGKFTRKSIASLPPKRQSLFNKVLGRFGIGKGSDVTPTPEPKAPSTQEKIADLKKRVKVQKSAADSIKRHLDSLEVEHNHKRAFGQKITKKGETRLRKLKREYDRAQKKYSRAVEDLSELGGSMEGDTKPESVKTPLMGRVKKFVFGTNADASGDITDLLNVLEDELGRPLTEDEIDRAVKEYIDGVDDDEPTSNFSVLNLGGNCGIAKGGFQKGNTCAKGDGQSAPSAAAGGPGRTANPTGANPVSGPPSEKHSFYESHIEGAIGKMTMGLAPQVIRLATGGSLSTSKRGQTLYKDQVEELKGVAKGIFNVMTLGTGPLIAKGIAAGVRIAPKAFNLLIKGLQAIGPRKQLVDKAQPMGENPSGGGTGQSANPMGQAGAGGEGRKRVAQYKTVRNAEPPSKKANPIDERAKVRAEMYFAQLQEILKQDPDELQKLLLACKEAMKVVDQGQQKRNSPNFQTITTPQRN